MSKIIAFPTAATRAFNRDVGAFDNAQAAHRSGRTAEAIEACMRLALGGIDPIVRSCASVFLKDECNV